MAIYEYSCPVCGCFEVFQRMSEAPLTDCPECAKKGVVSKVQRLISAPAFHLKGGGWYKTDYAPSSNGHSSSSSGHSSNKDKSSSETKSETKQDSKTDAKSTQSDS